MATEVLLPQWGMGMQEGTVIQWLKSVGDLVQAGEPLCEIETAKATDELSSPATGILSEIRVEAGTTAQVGDTLAMLADPPQGS
jgi:pyruvate/2-oxoglutarate dehydrogenase complex dihydrolipoamide acyltransferase (E2) component